MQGRAQLEPELWPDQIDDVAGQGTARGLQIAPGMVRHVQDPMRFVDQDAGRSELLYCPAVGNCLAEQLRRSCRLYGMRNMSERRPPTSEQAWQQPQFAGTGRRLIDARFAIENAK